MASSTIEKILRIKDQATPALNKAAKSADTATGALNKTAKATEALADETKKASTAQMALAGFMGGMGAAAFQKALAGVQALAVSYVKLGVNAVNVGAQMESFEARLSTLLGSTDAAKDRLAELFEIGSTTPFELGQLVEADATLEAFGVNAEKWRRPVMDLAGSMGLDLVEAAQAVGRAFAGGAGAADVLRDRGVLNMVQLRTGIKATEMAAEDFQQALFETFTDPKGRIAGGTDKLANTFSGMMSNLSDAWFKFQKSVADAGLFNTARATLEVILKLLGDNEKATEKWAKTTSDTLTGSFFGIIKAAQVLGKIFLSYDSLWIAVKNGLMGFRLLVVEIGIEIEKGIISVLENVAKAIGFFSDEGGAAVQALADSISQDLAKDGGPMAVAAELTDAMIDNRLEMLENAKAYETLDGASGVLDDIKRRAEELSATQAVVSVRLDIDPDTAAQMAALGMPLPGIAAPSAPKPVRRAAAKGSGKSELDTLAKQVESLTKKAFPTTQIDESTKLIEALTAARDRARRSRRDDFDALIADAKRARGELQSVEIRKWADTTASALATAQDGVANLNSEIEALAESAAQMLADRRAAMFGAATAGVGALSDVGGLEGGLGPAGGLVAAITGAGTGASSTAEQIADSIDKAFKERQELQARAAGGENVRRELAANKKLIETLEQQEEEGGLATMVRANVEGFIAGIEVLIKEFPRIITDVLPDLIGTLVPELIIALVEAAPHIAKAFIIDLPAALSQGFLEAFGKVFKQVKDFFKQLFLNLIPGRQKGERGGKTVLEGIGDFAKGVGKGLANLLTFGLVDSKQTGGFVNRTGLHLLHQGEFVQANSGTIPQSARGRMGGGGGGVNITINTSVVDPNSIDQLGRLLQRHFGGMGRSTLPIFGGA